LILYFYNRLRTSSKKKFHSAYFSIRIISQFYTPLQIEKSAQ